MLLLGCKFTSIKAILNKVQNIKDTWKEITYIFFRQDNRQQQSFSKFSYGSNSRSFASASRDSATSEGSAAGRSPGKDRKPIVTKSAG